MLYSPELCGQMDHRNQVLPLLSEFFCRCKLDPQHLIPCVGKTGDILTLRCWGRRNAALSQVRFYRDGKFLRLSKDNQPLSMGTATVNSSGRYSCTGQVTYIPYVGRRTSRTVMVQVQGESQLGGLGGREEGAAQGSGLTGEDAETLPRGLGSGQWGPLGMWGGVPKGGAWGVPLTLPAVCCPGSCVLSSAHLETHQPSCGAPPLRSSFYLSGDTLRNHMTPHGGAVSFLFPVTSEQDAGNYACEAENSVSKETSKPETLSHQLAGSLAACKPAWHDGHCCCTSRVFQTLEKNRSVGEQVDPSQAAAAFLLSVHCQNENDEGVIYSMVCTIPKESEARPAQSARREKVRRPQFSEVPAKGLNRGSRTQQDPIGDCEEVLC
ncbi:hypothetical protein E2I00_017353 [Balaenoptera physalus]|uniref:Ig-like domain-containing protein n=1 Tax=Balaenoptera physalus TaxID=9770 RepID=A0A643C3W5_BALPH|nr:hypothetical protein E2I00_017353 [Balaenoptera physalus]